MSNPSTNYRDVFRHQTLTKIQGEPNFASLKTLGREVKANAKSVHSTLGGAAHGHLGLVLSPAQYALISATPFDRVPFPATLAIPAGTTRLLADEMERNHKEDIRVFREINGVENALKSQLSAAIEPAYLAAILDPVTYDLGGTIHENLQFLMTNFGKVTPDTLNEETEKLNATEYNPALPIDSIFNAIIELAELAEAALIPFTPQQIITMGYNILNRSGRMAQDIKEWNRRPAHLKSWDHFKTYFRRMHIELRETTNDTMTSMHHANIAHQVIEGISHLIPPPEEEPPPTTETPPTGQALAATDQSIIIPSLISQMNQMQTMMMNMQASMCGNASGRGGRGGRGRGGGGQGRTARGGYPTPVFTKYCWTHGLCRHIGTECASPGEGHKPLATLENKMGGSTRNVTA